MKKLIIALVLFWSVVPLVSAQENTIKAEAYFGDLRARHIGPALMSGRINDLEAHPTNPRIIYAGTAGGGPVGTGAAGVGSAGGSVSNGGGVSGGVPGGRLLRFSLPSRSPGVGDGDVPGGGPDGSCGTDDSPCGWSCSPAPAPGENMGLMGTDAYCAPGIVSDE